MYGISTFAPSFSRIIILGDFNARTQDSDPDPLASRKSMDSILNPNGRSLLSLAAEEGLTICNGKAPGDPLGQFTFINAANGGQSVVDYAFVSPNTLPFVTSFQVLQWP